MPFPEPQKPCDCSQLLHCRQCIPQPTSSAPFLFSAAQRSPGGLSVLLPFLRGHVSAVSSFIHNLMPGFLLPSAHLSEPFLPHHSDVFSILSVTLFRLKVRHPHLQPLFPPTAACANNRIAFVLPASSCLSQHRADSKDREASPWLGASLPSTPVLGVELETQN